MAASEMSNSGGNLGNAMDLMEKAATGGRGYPPLDMEHERRLRTNADGSERTFWDSLRIDVRRDMFNQELLGRDRTNMGTGAKYRYPEWDALSKEEQD